MSIVSTFHGLAGYCVSYIGSGEATAFQPPDMHDNLLLIPQQFCKSQATILCLLISAWI